MGIIGGILAFIGSIIVIWFLYWLYMHELKKSKKKIQKNRRRPSDQYMNNVGLKCPDYWVYTGDTTDGKYKCKNTFNIPVPHTSGCLQDDTFATFSEIKNWNKSSKSERQKSVRSRCNWMKKCGASNIPSSRAVWLGVDQYCNE